jgi:hypothetical protein
MSIEQRLRSTLSAAGQHINPTASPMTASPGTPSSRSWLRRRLPVWPRTPVFASVLLVVAVGTTFATFAGVLPWQTERSLIESGCWTQSSSNEMVAAAMSAEGRSAELWIIRPGPDQAPNGHIVVDFAETGSPHGSSYGCSPPGTKDGTAQEFWAGVGGETNLDLTLLTVLGRVSPDAEVARVTLGDGTVIDIEVQTDGYFLELVTRPGVEATPEYEPGPEFEVTHLAALDKHGNVIEEMDNPPS